MLILSDFTSHYPLQQPSLPSVSEQKDSGVVGQQLSSLKSIAAQVVASTGTLVTSVSGTGLDMGLSMENKSAHQHSSEQMRRELIAEVHYLFTRL